MFHEVRSYKYYGSLAVPVFPVYMKFTSEMHSNPAFTFLWAQMNKDVNCSK